MSSCLSTEILDVKDKQQFQAFEYDSFYENLHTVWGTQNKC